MCILVKSYQFQDFRIFYFRYLDHNQFSGRIPEPFYKHPFLKEMWVSYLSKSSIILCSLNWKIISYDLWQVHWGKCVPAWCQSHWLAQSAWSFWFRFPCLMNPCLDFFSKSISSCYYLNEIAKIGVSIFAKSMLSLSINNSFLSLLFMIFSCTIDSYSYVLLISNLKTEQV